MFDGRKYDMSALKQRFCFSFVPLNMHWIVDVPGTVDHHDAFSCIFSRLVSAYTPSNLDPRKVPMPRNVVDRHYVMICGPGDDGQRGQALRAWLFPQWGCSKSIKGYTLMI